MERQFGEKRADRARTNTRDSLRSSVVENGQSIKAALHKV